MRLRTAPAVGVTAAVLALGAAGAAAAPGQAAGLGETGRTGPGAHSARVEPDRGPGPDRGAFEAALPGRQPTCGDPAARDFPIRTRVLGGPAAYQPGGGFHRWSVELTNTTAQACGNIHPVIVFTDRSRTLRPAQVQLEFYEEDGGGRHYPATVETTDRHELVGVLDDSADGFPGYTVPPGRTVTVPVRLAFTSDAGPDAVTVNAAIVQRRGDDGDWVGTSPDYRFTLHDGGRTGERAEELPRTGRDVLILAGAAAGAFTLGAGMVALAARLRHRRS
ncbi:hypothetical protein [Streptomyces lichenis]|uniref:Gram-positive cocci surface proteins LPxTG domain-containing protein n=1 Tax=Streptomyces lichenis TaxID=2306967 RepID=A0ABT0I5L5_9ACTN|nr:hypothetical protein [Streptomyces lichenis]MCK8676607.1 hypothetical protein [Streptomyces lichenis]